jgi:hypothetical protein
MTEAEQAAIRALRREQTAAIAAGMVGTTEYARLVSKIQKLLTKARGIDASIAMAEQIKKDQAMRRLKPKYRARPGDQKRQMPALVNTGMTPKTSADDRNDWYV